MKFPLDLVVPAFSLLLLKNAMTHVRAFCSATPAASGFKCSTYSFQTESLKSFNGDGEESENDENTHMPINEIRKARFKKDSVNFKQFASGEELKSLREDLESLRQNLEWARALKDDIRIESLEKAIRKGESRDPYFMHEKAQKMIFEANKLEDASDEEKKTLIEKWTSIEAEAREFLPHLNMEGLWVGNYGDSKGLQVINITYSGKELIATKVTGDANVPRGETSFTVNIEPTNATALPPVKLISDHRSGEFRRFSGRGQVSRKGFKDHRFVEGQMILFENRFTFVWIPTKHHVLFHRPSPEMTLKLLRDTISKEDEIENMRNHLSRCFNMDLSTAIARQQLITPEPMRRISTQKDLEEAEERLKQSGSGNNFFQIEKWRNYIDEVLDKKST